MKKGPLVILALLSFAISFAGNGNIKTGSADAAKKIQGKVFDKTTGETLTGVAIKLQGSDRIAFTDFEGNFSFSDVTEGTYNLNVVYVSYQTVTLKEIHADNSEVKLKIELQAISHK